MTRDGSTAPALPTALTRRTLLGAFVAAPVAAMVLAACGDDTTETGSSTNDTGAPTDTAGSGGIPHPTTADAAVIRLGFEGGFVPQGTAFVNTPSMLLSGDGLVFRPAPTTLEYPGALVAPMNVRTITEAGTQRLLTLAQDAGLLTQPTPDYTIESMVADAPNTVLRFAADDAEFVHSAYALDIPDAGAGAEAARETLRSYVALLNDLETTVGADQLGPESLFEPVTYRMQAYPQTDESLTGYDPAPTVVDWPAAAGVTLADATECATVEASAIGDLFSTATSLTFFREGDQVYSVAVAPVLPGDATC